MAHKIVLTITNPNNKDYPSVILRKFFNMVFIEPDGKSLSIYTATVFSGTDSIENKEVIPTPKCVPNVQCALRFDYAVGNANELQPTAVKFEDLTDSFFDQTEWVSKVWGKVTECRTQGEIERILEDKYPAIYTETSGVTVPDVARAKPFLTIEEESKGKTSHFCLVGKGSFDEPTLNGYQLSTTNSVAGIEAMNWIKSTITFKTDILHSNEKINFEIVLSDDCEFYTPDFTWYFAPPPNYEVDVETATLAIGKGGGEKNRISSVADNTTVEFQEWIIQENIKDRKKVRANIRDATASDAYALSKNRISVNLSFVNPERHGNTQFILGLIVAFLLSFCSDKTRLNDYATCLSEFCASKLSAGESGACSLDFCFTETCICPNICNLLGIIFPILIILAFVAISFSRKRCLPSNCNHLQKSLIWARTIGLIATVLLAVYIYVLWLCFPALMIKLIATCRANQLILLILVLLSCIGNLSYAFYCGKIRKNKIIDFM